MVKITKKKIYTILLKTIYVLFSVILLAICILVMLSLNEKARPPFVTGVTFRHVYARDILNIDWKQTYQAMLEDLQVKHIRLPVHWNDVEREEGKYTFTDIDFQMRLAEENEAKVILAIGRRSPGWPECHIPNWAKTEIPEGDQQKLLEFLTEVVERYKDSPALQYWQVENEPFLVHFGECPMYKVSEYLDQEIEHVKNLDPNHPILTTDSGELSLWVPAASRGDIFGSTLYRSVYVDHLGTYLDYYLPPLFFRAKKGLVHLFQRDKEIINIELQGEPWTHRGITSTPFEEQFITFPPGSIRKNLEFAHKSGFSKVYMWGVEYWYWAAQNGHPEFLLEAKQIFSEQNNENTGN